MATMETGLANGVSFALTDEQKELRALAREFAEKEIRPKAAEHDEHQTHPAEIVAKAHELGLMNLHLPESLGGPELSAFDGMLVGEELNWGCSGIGTSIGANGLARRPDPDRRHRGAEARMARAARLGADPRLLRALGARRRVRRVRASRRRPCAEGDEYVVNGSKMFITNAGQASWIVCFASTDRSKGHRGLTAFVIPMDAEGVTIEKHLDKMGQRATDTSAVAFQDVVVPGREPPRRRGRRLQDRDADARLHAPRHGGRRRRRRPGGVRARGRLREGARPVRHADRDEPGRLVPRRRHGDRDRGSAPPHLAGGVDDRPGLRAARRRSTRRSRSASPPTPR